MKSARPSLVFALVFLAGAINPALAAPTTNRELRVHDPSTIVKCKNEYWFFATGLGIVSRRSKDRVDWSEGPRVLTNVPAWITQVVPGHRGYFWAPDLIQVQGRYLLYYSVSTWGKNTSAIGLAVNSTLDPTDPNYRWTDHGMVIQSRSQDPFNAIDPSVMLDADGKLWLAFGSFWSGIKLIQLDLDTGRRAASDSPIHSLAHTREIEAPCLWRQGDAYYLFVNWGLCCRGTNSTYQIVVGRSANVTGPYIDKAGKDLLRGGGTLLLDTTGSFVGPGHAGIFSEGGKHWLSCHFYDVNRRGAATLALRPLHWGAHGWPVVLPAQ